MAPQEIVALLRTSPFKPFRLTLTEGTSFDIHHPELCMVGHRSAVIGVGGGDDPDLLFDRSVTVDLLHVVKLEPLAEPSKSANKNGSL